jgi:DNA helicase IV
MAYEGPAAAATCLSRAALRTQLTRLVRADLLRRRSEEVVTTEAVEADLRRDRTWGAAIDRIWPALSAPALVRRMLTNRAALASAADGLLSSDEQAAIRRPPTRRVTDEPWTAADLALVDEAEAAITGPPRVYGHIVVDEAQDLSTMGLRSLARRSRDASMTVLGDLAQATAPAAQETWETAIAALGGPATAQRADLDLGYRVPASIMDAANGLLAAAAPDVVPTRSVRTGGRPPEVVTVGDDAALAPAVGAAAAELVAAYASVAIIVPPAHRPDIDAALAHIREGDRARVTALDPPDAKGLEFDAVVVVEPAAIAGGTPRGLRLLYVGLTRAVQELVVVHRLPLPAGLDLTPAEHAA